MVVQKGVRKCQVVLIINVIINTSTQLSLRNEEKNEQPEIEQDDFTQSPTVQLHPDLMWITNVPYRKGALTQKQISDFVLHMLTGRIPGTPTGR